MIRDDFRQRANVVRDIPLVTVLLWRGAVRDPRDRSKWDTEQGPVSVTGAKFTNWQQNHGGGGAIDLVMHLGGMDYRAAVQWLERQGGTVAPLAAHEGTGRSCQEHSVVIETRTGPLRLPVSDASKLDRVIDYLTQRRCLAAPLLEPLLQSGKLYADHRGNAVFLLVAGKTQRPVGAELRGTGPGIWRGMAPGTRKDEGYFWTGVPSSREIVLCESAIDALSCCQLDPQRICISTSGVRTNPRWLPGLITRGYRIQCAFDTDGPGDAAAAAMIALHTVVRRLRPPAHDWNDALASSQ